MSDKLRSVYPIAIEFYDGEQPPANKLNGVSKQARNGLSIVEYAIGDLWNQSGDSLFSNDIHAPLMIPNLARYVGSPKNLSPYIPNLKETSNYIKYTHIFTNEAGLQTARLPFPVHTDSTFNWSPSFPARYPTPEVSPDLVVSASTWYIDRSTGDIFTYDPLTATDALTYWTGYTDDNGAECKGVYGDLGEGKTFNIIPDPDTVTSYLYKSVKIKHITGDDYHIFLPPRGPLNTRIVDGSPQDDEHGLSNTYNYGGTSSPFGFWLDDSNAAPTTDGAGASHYRYKLPKLITDHQSNGCALPTGFLYLYDDVYNKTIIEGVTFYADPSSVNSYTLVARGANLTSWLSTVGVTPYPSANLTSDLHSSTYYPPNGLKLITVGTSLSEAFTSLMKQFLNHDHSSQGSLVPKMVDHGKLNNLFHRGYTAPYFLPSQLPNDDHPQYLHRRGWTDSRDNDNAMLGHLILAASEEDGGSFLNLTKTSNKLYFGSTSGISIDQRYSSYDGGVNELKATFPSSSRDRGTLSLYFNSSYLAFQIKSTETNIFTNEDLLLTSDYINFVGNTYLENSKRLYFKDTYDTNTTSIYQEYDGKNQLCIDLANLNSANNALFKINYEDGTNNFIYFHLYSSQTYLKSNKKLIIDALSGDIEIGDGTNEYTVNGETLLNDLCENGSPHLGILYYIKQLMIFLQLDAGLNNDSKAAALSVQTSINTFIENFNLGYYQSTKVKIEK